MKRLFAMLAAAVVALCVATPAMSVGTIFGLPLSQQLGEDGKPLNGAKLYIYQANTSNPVTIYTDFALSVEATWPLEADAQGRLPEFWLADGSYRVRLTTAGGVAVFDLQSITALGPSSGAGGGGGVSDEQIFQSGDVLFKPVGGTRSGWVRANGRTIGNAASGATERANADTQALFEYLWNNCTDTHCPVSSGRGASAAADYAANKTIGVWDLRGRSVFGLDDMGSTAAGRIAGGTTVFTPGGDEDTTLATANMPSHDHTGSVSGFTDSDNHSHSVGYAETGSGTLGGGGASTRQFSNSNSDTGDDSHDHFFSDSFTTDTTGSGTAFSTLPPYALGTWYIKL